MGINDKGERGEKEVPCLSQYSDAERLSAFSTRKASETETSLNSRLATQ